MYVRDGATTLGVFTVNSAGTPTSWHVNLLWQDRVVGRQPNTGNRRYYHFDHLGSTRAVVEGATVVESYDFEPWGLLMPGRTLAGPTKEGFTSKEQDTESGLTYFGARHYMLALARWTGTDPLADKQPQWSPYNYALNNPLIVLDPDGQQTVTIEKPQIDWAAEMVKMRDQAVMFMLNSFAAVVEFFNPVPLRDMNTLITGKDITTGQDASRLEAAGFAGLSLFGSLDDIARPARQGLQAYEVGRFDALAERSIIGDGLDLHHAGQAHAMEQLIPGYSRLDAPAIALPHAEHALIPNLRGPVSLTPRDLLARDIRNLRNFTNVPNSSLLDLIRLNKALYPGAFTR